MHGIQLITNDLFMQNYFRRTPKASVNVNVAGSRQLPRLY